VCVVKTRLYTLLYFTRVRASEMSAPNNVVLLSVPGSAAAAAARQTCPITGGPSCRCSAAVGGQVQLLPPQRDPNILLSKEMLRAVFTDHAVYTNWLIVEAVRDSPTSEAINAITQRLMRNPSDIGRLLAPIIGIDRANFIAQQFSHHLMLAGAAVMFAIKGDEAGLKQAAQRFIAQGNDVGLALGQIQPASLSIPDAQVFMHQHNTAVVELVSLHVRKDAPAYISVYDRYYNHILLMSDRIYDAVVTYATAPVAQY